MRFRAKTTQTLWLLIVILGLAACGNVNVRGDLHARLTTVQEGVREYLDLYEGIPELPDNATVGEWFDAMDEASSPALPVLDSIEKSLGELEQAVDEAGDDGVDLGVSQSTLNTFFEEYAVWLEAHRHQANPNICLKEFPTDAYDDPIEDWTTELSNCFLAYYDDPLVQDGLDAADTLNSIVPELDRAWSSSG